MDQTLERIITAEAVEAFARHLYREEKSRSTRDYYLRAARRLMAWLDGRPVDKEAIVAYKRTLEGRGYKPESINTMIAAMNSFLRFLGWGDCRVKGLRCQQKSCDTAGKELERAEFDRLVAAAQALGNARMALLLNTLNATGLRVSELQFITVEAARGSLAEVRLKGKCRHVVLTRQISALLLAYAREQGITRGPIFITRRGKPMHRSCIWREMKALCALAGVEPRKVFPHNIRHLFARSFYSVERDLVKLSAMLGHSSINTTRIYILSSLDEYRAQLARMQLVYSGKKRKKKPPRKAARGK